MKVFFLKHHIKCPVDVKVYLFMVQHTLSGRETEMMGIELWGLAVVVELKTVGLQHRLQHFLFSIMDGNLQIIQS